MKLYVILDFPVVSVGPDNPYRVEVDQTAEMRCAVDSKPRTDSVRWEFSGRFIDTNFRHVIPQVSLQDAGKYFCSGDNGLGHIDKEELILDVQYGPQIVVSGANDVDSGETISLNCAVSANPRPLGVRWLRRDLPEFSQSGPTLRIPDAGAEDSGEYVCNSYNFLQPTGRERQRRERNATVVVNVRHAPGRAAILPAEAIAVAGRSVTLVCQAEPPGYPEPSYRWWRDGEPGSSLASTAHLTLPSLQLDQAGRYLCQPHNSLGSAQPAAVDLQVYQTPELTSKPEPRMVRKAGERKFQLSCSSRARPGPTVRWFRDGVEIPGETGRYTVSTTTTSAAGQTVLSSLSFTGPGRDSSDRLDHSDRGHYSCQFENQVGRSENTMLLVIEHKPIPTHPHNKVAYSVGDQGQITCRMRAFPEPRFDWTFGDDVLELDVVNYYSNVSQLDQDLFESVLTVTKVRESSYGEYTCRALNSMGAERSRIQLQQPGPPEPPSQLAATEVGPDFAILEWQPGFEGGHGETRYQAEWRATGGRAELGSCGPAARGCNLTGLQPHSAYTVRARAANPGGVSDWSPPLRLHTAVDLAALPPPASLVLELSTRTAHLTAPAGPLLLVAELQLRGPAGAWQSAGQQALSHAAAAQLPVREPGQGEAGVRARLCLEDRRQACGPYLEGRVVEELRLARPWLIALIVVVTLLALVAVLIAIKCVCQTRKNGTKSLAGRGPVGAGHHNTETDQYKARMFTIAGENQLASGYDLNQHSEQGSSKSQTDSANSTEPLWAYQKSPGDHYPSQALQGYENSLGNYPFIDETPTDPERNYFAYRDPGLDPSRPMSGQCEYQTIIHFITPSHFLFIKRN